MNITKSAILFASVLVAAAATLAAHAQGTVSFNQPWADSGIGYSPLYHFDGMSFRLSDLEPPYVNMAHVGATGPDGHPHNGTPYLELNNTLGVLQAVIFSRANAHTLGLLSVDLADPVAPSLSPVSITFNGYRSDGSTVSQTFAVGGSGDTTFRTFLFSPDFALGLTRVEIPSAAWAMDNIVWIPEPSTAGLFLVGLLAWAVSRMRARQ
jgi:hypothetical protein